MPGCELCAARPLTPWFHTDDTCWVAECLICRTPMVVWRRHGADPPPEDREHMLARLSEVAAERLGEGGFRIDGVMRRIPQSDQAIRRGEWPLVLGYVLRGKTLGILGLGKIGTEVAQIGRAFEMKIIAWGPTLTPERASRSQAIYTLLDNLLKEADVVSVHLALSDQSKNLLNEARLRLMKQSAYLINTARGAIVDERALVKVLQERTIAGAALDVFVEEPLATNHPLLQLDNVVLTPHLGWPTDSGFTGFAENAVTNILDYLDGKLTRVINPEALQNRSKTA